MNITGWTVWYAVGDDVKSPEFRTKAEAEKLIESLGLDGMLLMPIVDLELES